MNRLFVTFFFLSSLSGCATVRNDHFTTTPVPVELGNSLAADAIKQLQTLYPPAHTKFNIGQPVPKTDSFGTSLVLQMREKGYAVQTLRPHPTRRSIGWIKHPITRSISPHPACSQDCIACS